VISYVLDGAEEAGFAREAADEMAANMAFFFYVAGTETTAALIGNALLALAEHPDQREVLLRDPTLMPQAVEELLRYESPPPARHARRHRETEVRGPPSRLVPA
jgi:cytochrome P450